VERIRRRASARLRASRLVPGRVPRDSGWSVKRPNLAGWLFVLLVTGLVEVGVRVFNLHDSVAAPSATFRALAHGMASGALSGEIGTTLESYTEGLALAIAVGVTVGIVIGSSRLLLDASSVLIEFLRPIPAVTLIPLAILFFGLGIPMRRFVIAYAALWPILINTLYGVRSSDRLLHDVARTSGATRLGELYRVTLPAALPSIATGVRVSASIALLVGVTAEFFTGTGGLGSYMQRQQLAFELPELYAAIVLIGSLGYAINVVLRAAERRVVFWVGEERVVKR
jgi:ABC-type nitrate/sulfonate/bicarbonate transport system permease component